MKSSLRSARDVARPNARLDFEGPILRLVKGRGPERRAIEAGQVDAVIDPATGNAFLLPVAQAALRADQARIRRLLALSTDWCWEQDEFYRFVSHTGAASGSSGISDENMIGKTLWDLPFDSMSEADWEALLRLLEGRATFRDLEVRCKVRAGELRWFSTSGEPAFDGQGQFTGYRGTMRDITLRKQAEALAQKPIRLACDTLDALAVEVCVLDATGTVIMVNRPLGVFAKGKKGLGAGIRVGASYFEMCDMARGDERADGVAIAAGIRHVIARESPLFRYEYVCNLRAGQQWFNLTVTALPGVGPARVVVSRENVTALRIVGRTAGDGAARRMVADMNVAGRKRQNAARGSPVANRLLAVLPRKNLKGLLACLEPVTLSFGEVLYEPGDPIRHVYFPIDAIVSLLTTIEGHHALEVGLVGREGMVGISLALGTDISGVRALVQGTGTAMRMSAARFRKEFRNNMSLQAEVYRYTYAKLAQIRQTAACNNFHVVEARLARWLLMIRDRARSNEFHLTQEFISHMLGARRENVVAAAGKLQERNLIEYGRGTIRIVDQAGLEAAACECYQIVRMLGS
jgi:PAS domain S-box-containing protein